MHESLDPWFGPLARLISAAGASGGFLLGLGDYRPDLARALAGGLGLAFLDFRAEVMMPRGWDAQGVTFEELDDSLRERAAGGGLVAHNVEALLATRSERERRAWLRGFLAADWPDPVVLPLFLFAGDAPRDPSRVASVAAADLPEESLLGRLAFWGG